MSVSFHSNKNIEFQYIIKNSEDFIGVNVIVLTENHSSFGLHAITKLIEVSYFLLRRGKHCTHVSQICSRLYYTRGQQLCVIKGLIKEGPFYFKKKGPLADTESIGKTPMLLCQTGFCNTPPIHLTKTV